MHTLNMKTRLSIQTAGCQSDNGVDIQVSLMTLTKTRSKRKAMEKQSKSTYS